MFAWRRCAVRATALAALLACWNVFAVPIVPGGFAGLEGDSNNVVPFTNLFGTGYQQIYDRAAFEGASGAINSIAFRLDSNQLADASNRGQVNLSVKLGSSARSSQGVSPVFAENRGSGQVEVFAGVIDFSLADLPGLGPNPFDLRIELQRAFFFDGMQDLLLELTLLQPIVTSDPLGIVLDAASGPFGRAFTSSAGNLVNPGFGLITQFDLTPAAVAEPPLMALFLMGLALLASLQRRPAVRKI